LYEKKNVLNIFEHGTFDPLGHATKVGPFSSYEYCVKDNSLKKYWIHTLLKHARSLQMYKLNTKAINQHLSWMDYCTCVCVKGQSCLQWGMWVSNKKVLEDGKSLFGFFNKTLKTLYPFLKLSQISSLYSLVSIFNPYEKIWPTQQQNSLPSYFGAKYEWNWSLTI
jgi:hypothetical protein